MLKYLLVLCFVAYAVALPSIIVPETFPAGDLELQDQFRFNEVTGFGTLGFNSGDQDSVTVTGNVRSCDWQYWKLDGSVWENPGNYEAGDYLNILASINNLQANDDSDLLPEEIGADLVVYVKWTDASDIGADESFLPTASNYNWKFNVSCDGTTCNGGSDNQDFDFEGQYFMEIPPQSLRTDRIYWFGVKGVDEELGSTSQTESIPHQVGYTLTFSRRRVLRPSCPNGFECGGESITSQTSTSIPELTLGVTHVFQNDSNAYPSYYFPTALSEDSENPDDSWLDQNKAREWRYFKVQVPFANYAEGTYLRVNVSFVETATGETDGNTDNIEMYLNYGAVPWPIPADTLQQVDANGDVPSGLLTDGSEFSKYCLEGDPATFFNDEITQKDCNCKPNFNYCQTQVDDFENNQCDLTISPCRFTYASANDADDYYFIAVHIPFNTRPLEDEDDFDNTFTSYQITATIYQPTVLDVTQAFPFKITGNFAQPQWNLQIFDKFWHYKLTIDESHNIGDSYLRSRLTVGSGQNTMNLYVKKSLQTNDPVFGQADTRIVPGFYSGDDDCPSCYDDGQRHCSTCGTCQITYSKCELETGTYYYAVTWNPEQNTGDHLPAEFTVDFELFYDPLPVALHAGIPVHSTVEEGKHNFYSFSLNEVAEDQWLYVELFSEQSNHNLVLQLSSHEQPGQHCYEQGEFQCSTSVGLTGEQADSFYASCNFMIDTCRLYDGRYYLSVFGKQQNDQPEFYGRDIHYTLWVDIESPTTIQNNVTYTDYVRPAHYNHYVFDTTKLGGSWMTVEIDNLQPLIESGRDINAYLQYGQLAGECPCYSSLFNCTGNVDPLCSGDECDETDWLPDNHGLSLKEYDSPSDDSLYKEDYYGCCKLEVDMCHYKPGLWYIGVLGYNNDQSTYQDNVLLENPTNTWKNDPFGFTLTAIVHPGPPVFELSLDQYLVDWVAQSHHNHYQLWAPYRSDNERLVVRLTFMQDECGRDRSDGTFSDWAPKPDFLAGDDSLELRIRSGDLALQECYSEPWSCEANKDSFSSCTVVLPPCEWHDLVNGDEKVSKQTYLYLSVFGVQEEATLAQYTLHATIEEIPTTALTWGETLFDTVLADRYAHYYFDVNSRFFREKTISVDIYYNSESSYYNNVNGVSRHWDAPRFSLAVSDLSNVTQITHDSDWNYELHFDNHTRAGHVRTDCYDCYKWAEFVCKSETSCHWEFESCAIEELGSGRWFLSVYSSIADFYDIPLKYSLTVDYHDSITDLEAGSLARFVDHSYAQYPKNYGLEKAGNQRLSDDYLPLRYNHYRYIVLEEPGLTESLTVEFKNIAGGAITVFFNKDALAGNCPCYRNSKYLKCNGDDDGCNGDSCKFYWAPCDFSTGSYFFSVVPTTDNTGEFNREITWQIEVSRDSHNPVVNVSPTNTDASNQVFRLGIDDNLESEDLNEIQLIRNWIQWNSANIFDDNVLDNGEWHHYLVSWTQTSDLVYERLYAAIDNVRSAQCQWGDAESDANPYYVAVQAYYSLSPDFSQYDNNCGECGSYHKLGDAIEPVGSQVFEVNPCFGTSVYVSIEGIVTTDFASSGKGSSSFEFDSNLNTVQYDLKLFLQDTLQVSEGFSNARNYSSYTGQTQRFSLPGVTSSGNTPLTHVVFYNIQGEFDVYLNPSSEAQAGTSECGNDNENVNYGNCFGNVNSCTETRPGRPFTNSDLELESDGTTSDDTPDDFPNLNTFDFKHVCGSNGETSCTVSILPCGLRTAADQTTWFLTVVPRNAGSNIYYRMYWLDNVSPTTTISTISDTFINRRLDYPDSDRDTDNGDSEYIITSENDEFTLHTFTIEGLDHTTYESLNSVVDSGNWTVTVPNQDYVRLEVIIYEQGAGALDDRPNGAFAGQAEMIWWVVQDDGELPPIPAIVEDDEGDIEIVHSDQCTCDNIWFRCAYNSCSGSNRFYVPSCCLSNGKWWVIGRQLQPGYNAYQVQVRLINQRENRDSLVEVIDPADLQLASGEPTPQTGDSFWSVSLTGHESTGVEPSNYHHYVVPLYQESFFHDESTTPPTIHSIVLRLDNEDDEEDSGDDNFDECNNCGTLILFARLGDLAGHDYDYGIADGADADKTCFGYEYACRVGLDQDDFCTIEIPACSLAVGNLYISVYHEQYFETPDDPLQTNPDNAHYAYDSFKGYDLEAFFSRNGAIDLDFSTDSGFSLTDTQGLEVSSLTPDPFNFDAQIGLFHAHYAWEIPESLLSISDCDGSFGSNCHHRKQLEIYVRNVERVDIDDFNINSVWLSTPSWFQWTQSSSKNHLNTYSGLQLGGGDNVNQPAGSSNCYDGFQISGSIAPTDDSDDLDHLIHTIDVCNRARNSVSLLPGWYYLSFVLSEDTQYIFSANLVDIAGSSSNWNEATVSPTTTSFQDENVRSIVAFSSGDITTSDQTDWWWTWEITDSDISSGHNYLQVNLTSLDYDGGSAPEDTVYLELWKESCQYYDCNLDLEDDGYGGCYRYKEDGKVIYLNDEDDSDDRRNSFDRWVIDADGLSPCSITAGRYFLHFHRDESLVDPNDNDPNELRGFDVNVLLRQGNLVQALFNSENLFFYHRATIWHHQYQFYEILTDAQPIPDLNGFDVTVYEVGCGDLSVYLKEGTVAGPTETILPIYSDNDNNANPNPYGRQVYFSNNGFNNGVLRTRGCSGCYEQKCSASANGGSCTITQGNRANDCSDPTAQNNAGNLWNDRWYVTVHATDQEWQLDNAYTAPVAYRIKVELTRRSIQIEDPIGCPWEVDNTVTVDYNCPAVDSESVDEIAPTVLEFEVDPVHFSTSLALYWEGSGTVYYNWDEAPSFNDCSDRSSISEGSFNFLYDGSATDWFNTRRLYVLVSTTSSASVTLYREDVYVPVSVPSQHYSFAFTDKESIAHEMTDYVWYWIPQQYMKPDVDPNVAFRVIIHDTSKSEIRYSVRSSPSNEIGHLNVKVNAADGDEPDVTYFSDCSCAPSYIRFEVVTDSECGCEPVHVTWSWEYILPVELLECGIPMCDTVGDSGEFNTYNLNPQSSPDANTLRQDDATWTSYYTVVRVDNVNNFGEQLSASSGFGLDVIFADYDDTHSSVWSKSCAQHTDVVATTCNSDYYEYELHCPYDEQYVTVQSTTGQNTLDDIVDYEISMDCVDFDIEDISTDVASTSGFERVLECDSTYYFSWHVTGDFEFNFIDITAEPSAENMYYAWDYLPNADCKSLADTSRISDYCTFSSIHDDDDDEQHGQYLKVVTGSEPVTLSILIRAPSNSFDNTELTLGTRSDRFELGDFDGFDHVFYFDVDESDISVGDSIEVDVTDLSFVNDAPLLRMSHGVLAHPDASKQSCLSVDSGNTNEISNSAYHRNTVLVADDCETVAGRYYITLRWSSEECGSIPPSFRLTPKVVSSGIEFRTLSFDGSLIGEVVNKYNRINQQNWYQLAIPDDSIAIQIWFANVAYELDYWYSWNYPYFASDSLEQEFPNTQAIALDDSVNFCSTGDIQVTPCTTDRNTLNDFGANSLFVNCNLNLYDHIYVGVAAYDQENRDVSVSYDIHAQAYSEYQLIPFGEEVTLTWGESQAPINALHESGESQVIHPLRISLDGSAQAITIHVDVEMESLLSSDNALYITVRDQDSSCSSDCDSFSESYRCYPQYGEWSCDFEISRLSDFPFNGRDLYVLVKGNTGTATVSYTLGGDNCVHPEESLSFCSGIIDYPVWHHHDLTSLDDEAACFYEALHERFTYPWNYCQNDQCDWGITEQCDYALKAFACAESFHPCHESLGFVFGPCRNFCTQVTESCEASLASIGYGNYNCDHTRYQDDHGCDGQVVETYYHNQPYPIPN